MPEQQILVIEDDAAIRRGVVDALQLEGYATLEAGDGDSGLRLAIEAGCDLVLLDLILPGPDGLAILGAVREKRRALPIIILTARGEEAQRVEGLRLGADDYIVKPFSVKELLARVEAVLRRSTEPPPDVDTVTFPGGRADLARRTVQSDGGKACELSQREAELLRYLASRAGRLVPRDELLARVWHVNPSYIQTRTVDMHIARLREKLGDDRDEPRIIRTVRGEGYLFVTAGDGP
ncbi:MAG: response regulator transcription factor [Verrucomicrobia bacterium]|nr:response regulator transcription factor [Verrucomicrobiota bacterium]